MRSISMRKGLRLRFPGRVRVLVTVPTHSLAASFTTSKLIHLFLSISARINNFN